MKTDNATFLSLSQEDALTLAFVDPGNRYGLFFVLFSFVIDLNLLLF